MQEFFSRLLGILCTGLAIKLMDDFLDMELDQLLEKKTQAMELGNSSLPYALVLLSFGILLNGQEAASLFLASYMLGMHGDLLEEQPSNLKGYQESLLLLFFSLPWINPREIFSSFQIILSIQIVDDFLDYYQEPFPGRKNLIKRWGKGICLVTLLISLSLSFLLALEKSILVLSMTPIIIYWMEKRGQKEGRRKDHWNICI